MSATTKRDWKQHALERLHADEGHSTAPLFAPSASDVASLKDSTNQTLFLQDECVETVVTTADLGKLLPIPDDATFMKASKASLLRVEEKLATLQAFIQRELTIELQDAGVGFSASALDDLNQLAAFEMRKRRADFHPRQQVTYHGAGGKERPKQTTTRDPYAYIPGGPRYELYSDRTRAGAKALEEMKASVETRHRTFDEVDKAWQESVLNADGKRGKPMSTSFVKSAT